VESLSAYARQFLQMMEKPDVDSIDGLSPAISIDQKTTSRNPRSTVGTVTEVYDYLRLLFARVGRPHCPICGRPIAGQSLDQIVEQVLALPEGTRFTVNAPVVRDRKGEFRDVLEELRADGFTRVKVDGEQRLLEDEIVLDKKFKHTIEVVVDRLVMKPDLRQRLTQSVETATSLAEGLVAVDVVDGAPPAGSGIRARCSSPRTSPVRSTVSRCRSWSRASSRSMRRTARVRAAPGSAPSSRSTPICSCPTRGSRSRRGRWCPGRSATAASTRA
jgi:excinuclease UvrABC ATPase subunit